MKSASFVAAALLAPAAFSGQVNCGQTPCADAAPKFEAYTAQPIFSAPAEVALQGDPEARRFRTVLRAGAATGPNFAGHFTVVTWGCGVACQSVAIVDSTSGHVYFPPALKLNAYHAVRESPLPAPFQFRLDSKLLVVVGAPNDGAKVGVFYYVWEAPKLRLIYSDPREWPP